jgi:hypothetical protein
VTKDHGPKSPLPWRQRKTPKRGSKKSRNWRRIYPGYVFPDTVWTVVQGPYQRIRRHKSKSWVTVVCGDCGNQYERRLDHLVGGKSHRCIHCSVQLHKPWEHWALKRKKKESMNGVVSITVPETDQNQEPEQELDLSQWPPRRRIKGQG